VRGIAAKVGVASNAVYTYSRDKASLIKAVGERLLAEIQQNSLDHCDEPWHVCIETLPRDSPARLAAHPCADQKATKGPPATISACDPRATRPGKRGSRGARHGQVP
jgi:AcrR family transcriptional regulator